MSQGPSPHLSVENVNDVTVARFVDEHLDQGDLVRKTCDELDGLLDAAPGASFLLDLGDVRYVSSTLLGRLIQFQKKCAAAHGRVKLCRLTPYMRTVFEVGRLDRVFEIYDDEDAALAAFASAEPQSPRP